MRWESEKLASPHCGRRIGRIPQVSPTRKNAAAPVAEAATRRNCCVKGPWSRIPNCPFQATSTPIFSTVLRSREPLPHSTPFFDRAKKLYCPKAFRKQQPAHAVEPPFRPLVKPIPQIWGAVSPMTGLPRGLNLMLRQPPASVTATIIDLESMARVNND